MNPKLLLAFAGGVLLAGASAFFLTSDRGRGKAGPTDTAVQTPALVQDVASAEPPKSLVADKPAPPPWPKAASKPAAMPPIAKSKPTTPPNTLPSANSPVVQPPVLVAKADPPTSIPPTSIPRATEGPASRVEVPSAPAKPPRVAAQVTIPEGTSITVRINSTLSTAQAQNGETFTGTLDTPIVIDEMVIAEKGSRVEGKVAESTPSGRVKGRASLALVLTSLSTSDGQKITIRTDNFVREGESSTKSDATKIGVGAAAGAALGAIFGGGKGAAIGAASGGAAGTGVVLATRGKPAVIAVETRVPFRLAASVTVTEKIP